MFNLLSIENTRYYYWVEIAARFTILKKFKKNEEAFLSEYIVMIFLEIIKSNHANFSNNSFLVERIFLSLSE